jgi:hypothetical protein
VNRILLASLLTSITSAMLAVGAQAVAVPAPPAWPIPADAPAAPPPIPTLPPAGGAPPPADQITDPVTPAASCGDWYLQSAYGDRWPAASTWWEYRCTSDHYFYYDPCVGGGACDAFCPSCYVELWTRTDYFHWNGSDAVFHGQDYFYSFYYTQVDWPPGSTFSAWWDAPTVRWYVLGPRLTVSREGGGSGVVTSNPAGISCGEGCQASFDAGTSVTLTATPDASSVFAGWSGDCSGTGACEVTMDQARSVGAIFEPRHFTLTVSTAGLGHGLVYLSPGNVGCSACTESYAVGTVVALTASPDASSTFTGWSGDCSGAGACQVRMDQAHAVTATFIVSTPPTARFTVTCTGLGCSFDGSSSAGGRSIVSYTWSFGDGTSGAGRTADHRYPRAGAYTVTLTVTDDVGASAAASQRVNPISLSARGYKAGGVQKVDLSWVGPTSTTYDVYRDDTKVVTVSTAVYTDSVGKRSGSYRYRVCAPALSSCSSDATVSF